jgi:Flp pilus assembly protein TadD
VELEEKIAALKEKGNNQFRKKAYKEAIKNFSEAVKLFEETGRPIDKGDIKTKIT